MSGWGDRGLRLAVAEGWFARVLRRSSKAVCVAKAYTARAMRLWPSWVERRKGLAVEGLLSPSFVALDCKVGAR